MKIKLTIIAVFFLFIITCFQAKSIHLPINASFFKNLTHSGHHEKKEYDWYFKIVKDGVPPLAPPETSSFNAMYNSRYIGNTSNKELYLTFDQGYENGYTGKILDILKSNNVGAAFFVVKPYITDNVDLVNRMVREGHLVCNHSANHPSMAKIDDEEKFKKEFTDVEDAFRTATGAEMPKYFRPPMGKYSEYSLKLTEKLGYRTVFWSLAYVDWEKNKQPSAEFAESRLLGRCHNGAIILLHTVSKTNAEILNDLIVKLKSQGYVFKTLDQMP